MTSLPATAKNQASEASTPGMNAKARRFVAWSSLFFAILQSICTFFAALNGFRLAIGISSLAIAATAGGTLDRLHANTIRIPMVTIAILGAVLNLVVLMQLRRLRRRPAAQWRQTPLTPKQTRMERTQWTLSILTLFLVAIEESLHFLTFHHL